MSEETTPISDLPMRPEAPDAELGLSKDEMDLLPLKDYFDLPGNNYKDQKNLQNILGWAISKGISDRDSMFTELRRIEMKLGAPQLGESRTGRLSRYLILEGRANQALKEMSSFERK